MTVAALDNPHDGLAGRWLGILVAKGVDKSVLDGRQHACPLCGGKDRFRFDDKDQGRWYCNHCGAGDGFTLLMGKLGVSFKEVLPVVRALAGRVDVTARPREQSDRSKRERMNRVWSEAVPQNVALSAYLASRGIPPDLHTYPSMIRWHKDLRCDGTSAPAVLIKCFRWSIDGRPEPVTIQRHWPSLGIKKMMPSPVKQDGIFCPLGGKPQGHMGVAEGYVTALAVMAMQEVRFPVWACMSADQLARFMPPPHIHTLTIYGDNDTSFTGQAVAYTLARKLRASHPKLTIEVAIAEIAGRTDVDFDDVLKATQQETA